jgi:hypothetical protein
MKRAATIDPRAFPAFTYFLRSAMEFADVSGGRFSRYDLESSRRWLKQRKWREDPPSRRIEYLIELFPVIFDYQTRADTSDYDLKRDCAEAQRLIFREAVEKACISTIHMVEHFNRDWEEQGVDWDQALLQGESFSKVASKLLNYRDKHSGCCVTSRTLATAMFVTDFGLYLGLPKVPCLKDEMLLKLFQDKASQVQSDSSSGESFTMNSTIEIDQRAYRREYKSRCRSTSVRRESSNKRSNRGKYPSMIELTIRNPHDSASKMRTSKEKHSMYELH